MQKLIDDLKAAIAAEKTKTPALSTASAMLVSMEERVAEHLAQTAPATPAKKTSDK